MTAERRIRIVAGDFEVPGVLDGSPVAEALWAALPVRGRAQSWGDEIYFGIPIHAPEDPGSERETVEMGAIGYWPPGNALCLFFGPTPMSVGDEIRPASAVNVMGRMEGDPRVLKHVADGSFVTVEAA